MPITCPACRAVNEQGPGCRRCKADLSMLFAVEAQRSALLATARAALAQNEPASAFSSAKQAGDLRCGADVARLRALAALLRRDFAAAWKEYRRACSLSAGGS
jgi:hypothetical protein